MLHQHRENRHGQPADSKSITFTDEEIARMNREHDERMGWSPQFSALYTNPMRLPETKVGEPWK